MLAARALALPREPPASSTRQAFPTSDETWPSSWKVPGTLARVLRRWRGGDVLRRAAGPQGARHRGRTSERDGGVKAEPDNIFLTNGASEGVKTVLNLIISSEKTGVGGPGAPCRRQFARLLTPCRAAGRRAPVSACYCRC